MRNNVQIITLGCKVNQSESEGLAAGCRSPNTPDPGGDLCIINTCAVTQKAEMQSRQAVRKAVRSHPDASIVVTGCYAQRDPAALAEIPGVDYIIGQADKHRIPEIVSRRKAYAPAAAKDHPHEPGPTICHTDISGSRQFDAIDAPATHEGRTRPFLKIQDGCDAFCTYCIVPYTRGRSRSLPPEDTIAAFKDLLAAGAPEIVLSGIHIGRYGADLDPRTSLQSLLERLDAIAGVHRIRLSSIEPTELTDELLDMVRDSNRICPHFHVPLQSGDPRILDRMKRPYDPALFAERITAIRDRFPDAAIGADVLVGFPGEDNAAFERTRELIESLPVTYLHVFPYSARPGTPAAGFDGAVPTKRIKERCRRMHQLGLEKKRSFYHKMVGRSLDVVIQKNPDSQQGLSKGLSDNYLPVYLENAAGLQGKRTVCQITAARPDQCLKGVPI